MDKSTNEVLKAVPMQQIGELLEHAMKEAVANGANSISMPDEYVAIAHFLAYPEQYVPIQQLETGGILGHVETHPNYVAGFKAGRKSALAPVPSDSDIIDIFYSVFKGYNIIKDMSNDNVIANGRALLAKVQP